MNKEDRLKHQNFLFQIVIFCLIFLSGAAALIYEVLWMRETGLIFGNSAHAAATTLTAFFSGLAIGGHYWGKRVSQYRKPLALYAVLELATALTALIYFFIADIYSAIYPFLFNNFLPNSVSFLVLKFLMCVLLLFPPAFFIGGTLPVISHTLVNRIQLLGNKVSLIYAVNLMGAGIGVIAAGFYLPQKWGIETTYYMAVVINILIGVATLALMYRFRLLFREIDKDHAVSSAMPEQSKGKLYSVYGLAFLSGFAALALQVFWNRMFSQVLQNSVYTFSAILVAILLLLALGSLLANRIMKLQIRPHTTLQWLLFSASILLLIANKAFFAMTGNLQYFGNQHDWQAYIFEVCSLIIIVIFPPMLVLGAFFPYLLKMLESETNSVGYAVGNMTAINTLGAIIGSATAGFLFLKLFGPWGGIEFVALILLFCGLVLALKNDYRKPKALLLPLFAALTASILWFHVRQIQLDGFRPEQEQILLQTWQGAGATVTVTEDQQTGDRQININRHYSLGGSATAALDEIQSIIPLALHRQPESVFLLGLGTGITAGAALQFPIKKLVATELSPEVIKASKQYFQQQTRKLFDDNRAHIFAEDGRQYLMATEEQYDVIIGDLFLPWKAGSGNLYTVEHFQAVRKRLKDEGLFMQWLPNHQITEQEFMIIAKTMLQVFPRVTLWRGDFVPRWSVVGLLGQIDASPVNQEASEVWLRRMEFNYKKVPLLAHYMGNLSSVSALFNNQQLNTDDKPIIEYLAPISERKRIAGQVSVFNGSQLLTFAQQLRTKAPFEQDEYLHALPYKMNSLPEAGLILHKASVDQMLGDKVRAAAGFKQYHQQVSRAFK